MADNDPDDGTDVPDLMFVDIFGVADGMIVEHWDVIQMLVTWTASGELGAPAMWDPDAPDQTPAGLVAAQAQWTVNVEERGSDFCGWNVCDVFRFDSHGRIAEQWSVKARVACVSVNSSTPF